MKITKELTLPPETASRALAILAQRGAGKSYTGMKLAEEMLLVDTQIVCLDPVGIWWGLKADGKGKGFPILVMGGEHGDIPLAHTSGIVVADFVVTSGHSVVLDLSSFHSNAEQTRFVTDFAERLYRAKNERRTTLHLFLDEADSFIPQRPMPGEMRMLGAMEAIVRRGRSRGLGMTMITQRPAVINKNVLTQADLLIAMRVVGIQDHKALSEWTALNGSRAEQGKFLAELPSLPTGTAFFWSPSWLGIFQKGKILEKRTFDSSRTPEPGMTVKAPALAAVDIKGLSAEILATVEVVKANDPKLLRAEIVRLQAELLKAQAKEAEKIEVEVPVLGDEDRETLTDMVIMMGKLQEHMEEFTASLKPIRDFYKVPAAPPPAPPAHFVSGAHVQGGATPKPGGRVAAPVKKGLPPTALNDARMRILTALYWLRHEPTTPAKVAFYARYTVNGHFNNTLGQLRSAGYVEGWKITWQGEQLIAECGVADKPSGLQLREWLREKLDTGANRILDVLMNYGGNRVPIPDLAAEAGYTVNGHFNNCLGKLRSLQIAEGGAKDGGVLASQIFFQ